MGGLSSGPGPGLCLLTLVVLIVAQQVQSAPVQEDNLSPQSRAQGYYDGSSSELSTGCYYNFQHYGEGDRIVTNEPCLNCTCHNRMLMCYLRVCPFTKAIGQNCTIEKKPGQCCPLIICPEVPVQLLTSSTTTEHSESLPHRNQIGYGQYGTAIGHLDDYGCKINGEFYTNGAQIPGNIDKPCEVCYCIRNRTACIMQECTLQVEGCIPVYEEGLCCPVRYQCDYEYNYNAITTEQPRPTPGLVLTTTTSGPFECQHDNKWYADGAMVETEDSCEHCYCMKGDIVCAVQECKPPFEKDGHNCTAMPPAPGKCCPDSYHCDGNEIVDESEPTFRQDRMHKFGQNNANITMSITSSTSSGDKQHSWHYGTSSNENEMPNRFTDEHDKDGTAKPGKPTSDSDMMVTEGVPPTSGPLESGSHHVDGHGGGGGMRPLETHTGMRPMEGQQSTSQGHGVSTDNMLTISQVIQSIVQNQTNLFNQNKLNQTGKPEKKPSQHDDKIIFPTDVNLQKRPGMEFQTDEDGNPIEAHAATTDFPNEYYGITGSSPNIYAEHGGKPQKKPSMHKKPGTAGTQDSAGQPALGGDQDSVGHKRPGMAHNTSGGEHEMTQHAQKKPIIHKQPGMAGTLVVTDDEGNPIEIYEGATGEPEMVSGRPGSGDVHSGFGEQGRPQRPGVQEVATGLYEGAQEGFTGRPGTDGIYSSFDEHGKPQKRPIIHKKPAGVGGEGENVMGSQHLTGKPGVTDQPEIFGEHGHVGRPHKKPITHKKPGTTDDMLTESYGGITRSPVMTDRPVTDEHGRPLPRPGSYGDSGFYGKPQKRPGIHKQPGGQMSEDMTEGYGTVTETAEGVTGQYEIHTEYDDNGFTGRPHIPGKPGSSESSVLIDGHGKPVTDSYDDEGEYTYYDKYGKPHKRPVVHKRPIYGSEEGGLHFEETTELPEGLNQDELNVPSKKPQIHTRPSITPESDLTDEDGNPLDEIEGTDGDDEFEIFYDKYGRPHKRPSSHKTPVEEAMTDKYGKPFDEAEAITKSPDGQLGKPEDQNYFIYYDQYGRPHKRPVTHKKPISGVMTDEHGKPVYGIEGVTDVPEGFTGKPDTQSQEIYYDEYGRPQKRPVTHKKPGTGVMTDEQGAPVTSIEGVTDLPDGFTVKPGAYDQDIFYDEHGRPHRRPVTHKKPTTGVITDGYGKPVEADEGMTDFPESFTGKPETVDYQIFYDEHGRPHRRPITHKKPVSGVMTDEHGKPIDGVEDITDTPEGFTGKPGTDDYQIFYDQHGRPHKRPVTHKKPVTGVMTDEHGKPVHGLEDVTDIPEGHTGKPGTDDHQIYYDEQGRPHRRPVTHKTPVTGVLTDEHGKPVDGVEGVTDAPEGYTGKPETVDQEISYDEHGRPHKRPVTHKKPVSSVITDEQGKPIDGVQSVTEFPEGFTGKPETEGEQIYYDEHGRPHKRPITHTKPEGVMTDEYGKPLDGVGGVTDTPEGYTGKPETEDQQIYYDEHGRPHKRPVTQKKPVSGVMTDEHGKPVYGIEGVTDVPEGFTGKPDTVDQQIYYDEHGRPYKRPVSGVMTDDDGIPVHGEEDVTDVPEGYTGKPGTNEYQIIYDQHGRPHKRPITHKKPVSGVMTDEHGKPVHGLEGVTDVPEGFTGKPDTDDQQIYYDEHGRPYKRPVTHTRPEQGVMTDEHVRPVDGIEGVTDTPEGYTGKPETEDQQIFYDEHGRPQKRPVTHKKPVTGVMTDEHGEPIEEMEVTTDFPEGFAGKPVSHDQQIYFDQQGRPHKRPITHDKPVTGVITDEHGKPVHGLEDVTDIPEDHTGKPETEDQQIFYDEQGRPHRRPVTHKTPVTGIMTDEQDKPVHGIDGVTDVPEGFTGKPETEDQQIYYDEHGRPHKRPVTHKKPVTEVVTDEHGKPVHGLEDVTDVPEGHTGKPETEDQQIFYDQHGRPHIRPVTDKKPTMESGEVLTDEHEKPFHGVTKSPEGHVGESEYNGVTDVMIGYGHTGKPDIKPGHIIPGPEGVQVLTDGVGSSTEDYEGTTGTSGSETVRPMVDHKTPMYVEPGVTERPQKRPDTHGKPGAVFEEATDEVENKPQSPDQDIHPIHETSKDTTEKPGMHVKPGENALTDEQEHHLEATTETPEKQTHLPGTVGSEDVFYDQFGRPQKKPIAHTKPGEYATTEVYGKPGENFDVMTEIPESSTDKPESDSQLLFYDQYGRPHKRPVTHKKPGEGTMTDEHGKPTDGTEGITDVPEGFTGKPDTEGQQIFYDEHGRPHKRPVTHKKPGTEVMTDEHGKPVEGAEGITDDVSEGYTGKPETEDQQIYYDEHGRPHKRPVTHTKPEEGVMTDEHGRPVDGMEGVTDVPEEYTGKPGTEDQQIYYDEHGRPHRRPVTHKTPVTGVLTDEHGKPLDGVEGVTDVPEGFTGKPDVDGQQIYFDEEGRPHKRPVTHGKPVTEVMTDDHVKPIHGIEGDTDVPEAFTGKPDTDDQQIYYDEHGRPHKRPVTHTKPEEGVMTDEHGRPVDGIEGITEGYTDKPETEEQQIFYDEHGRPHKLPVTPKEPEENLTDGQGEPVHKVSESPGSSSQASLPDSDGQPVKRPVITSKPEVTGTEEDHEGMAESFDGVTGVPERVTEGVSYDNLGRPQKKPGMTDEVEHGLPHEVPQQGQTQDGAEYGPTDRPHSRPSADKEPSTDISDTLPEEGESFTKHPTEGVHDDLGEEENFFGEAGRPQKKPVLSEGHHPVTTDTPSHPVHTGSVVNHTKPDVEGTQVLTHEIDQQPVEKGTTEIPEEQTVTLEEDKIGQPGQKDKTPGQLKPDSDGTDENEQSLEESPEKQKVKPGQDTIVTGHDHDLPQKRPDSYPKPGAEEMTEREPELEEMPQIYDDHGQVDKPQKIPEVPTKPGATMEEPLTEEDGTPIGVTTELPETETGEMEIFYDKYGRPHKRPVTHKKPEVATTGEHVQPDHKPEGMKDVPEGLSGKPETDEQQIHFDPYGRPHKKPVTHEKPEGTIMTTEHDMDEGVDIITQSPQTEKVGVVEKDRPTEGDNEITDLPEGFTGKPDTDDQEIFYDEHGRPHKRPVTHTKPEEGVMTDEHSKPIDGVEDVTDVPEGFTGKPETEDEQIFYDEHGRPHKRPVTHKTPVTGVLTDEHGKPLDGVGGVTDTPEGYTGKPETEDQQIYYDEHGRPHKRPVTQKKPVSGVMTDEHGKPVYGIEGVTDVPEGFTGKPDSDDQQIYFDEEGRPHKRPVTEVMTDEHGKPVDGVEGVTDAPEGYTGKPETEDQQIFYDQHGRPHIRPVTDKKPTMESGEGLTDEHEKPFHGVTKSPEGHIGEPEHDDTTETMIEYGEKDKPSVKPDFIIPGPEGVSTMEEVESMTKSPGTFSVTPESDAGESSQTGTPEDVAETYEYGKPLEGETKPSEEDTKEPEHGETSKVPIGHDDSDRPEEKPHSQMKPFTHRPQIPSQDDKQPEKDQTHPVYDDQKPSHHWQPEVTGDDGTTTVEDLTETPDSENAEKPMIFGEHGHTGTPHKRPVKPGVPGTSEPEDASGTADGKPEVPYISHGQDVSVDEATTQKTPVTSEDHEATDEKKPELASDEITAAAPEKATVLEKDEHLHQRPVTDDSQFTDDVTETSDKEITVLPGQQTQKKPDQDAVPVEKIPETHEIVTEKLGESSTEIYYDDLGQPHKRPVHAGTSETDKKPEMSHTDLTTMSSEHGADDGQSIPFTTSVIDGAHTTEGAYRPDEIGKPGSASVDESKPELDGEDLTHVMEAEGPHKKPVLKPSADATGTMVGETGEPEIEMGLTERPESGKPEVHDEETGFKPSKKPVTQDLDEGVESTTLSSGTAHDTNVPGLHDGQTPVDHGPEENEITGGPEEEVTGVDDDAVTNIPEITIDTSSELSRPQEKPTAPDHGSGVSHTASPDLLHHYPQQQHVPSKTPEGDHPSGDDTTTEDDDESLIITTDESGEKATEIPEVLQEVHKKPESDVKEKPIGTKTETPSHAAPVQAQEGSTPSSGSQFDDFTTPVYGAHDASGAPVTEKGGVSQMATGKPDEHVPGVSTGFDEESKPEEVTTPKGIFETLFPTTEHVVKDKDHVKPASEDKTPGLTGGTPTSEDHDDGSPISEKDSNQTTPSGISDTEVSHGETHPELEPTQDTDGVTSPDANVLPGVVTPASTPEGTHGVPESAGSVPSGEMHPVTSSSTETPVKVSETKPTVHQPPQVFLPYLPPDDGSSTKHPILIDEGLHESSAPFDDILNNLSNILRPSQTTEEPEGTTEDHGEVPGEGSCFMDGVTYQHNADIPPLSPCHTKCTCISSIIHCLSLKCPPPPEDVSHCTVVHEENSCCPIYVCGTDVSPAIPVENHEGETSTDISTDKDESATVHGYEPSKTTESPVVVTSQKPEGTVSEDSTHTDQDKPIKHEVDDKTSQESKPGVVSESKRPQLSSDVPKESDKGTPITEKPEDSVDEDHITQGTGHTTSLKPELSGTETSTESKIPTKISEDGVTPDTSHVRPEEPQSGYRPVSFGGKHPSTSLPIYFGTEKPELPYQSHKKPESVDHVLGTDKPDQEGTEKPSSPVEGATPHGDKQKPSEMDGSKPVGFVEPTTYRPVYHGTTTPANVIGGVSQEDKTPDKFVTGEGQPPKPEEPEKETSEHKHGETDSHPTLEEQEPVRKPSEKPDEITASKEKPALGQEPVVTEELEHQTTEKPGEKEPQIHEGVTSEDEGVVHSTSSPHEQPGMDVKPSYLDETLTHTTVESHAESPETEGPYSKPQSTDKPENNFVQSSTDKPELHHGPTIPEQSGESDPSIKRPITHDKPSEEKEDQKQTSTLDADRPTEVFQTVKPKEPISMNGTERIPTDGDLVSTDKTHGGAPRPTYDNVAGDEKPSEKPEESTQEQDETLAHSTSQPDVLPESGKPVVPSEEATYVHKKPQFGHDGGEETFATSEGPHKESETEVYPSPVSEDSAHVTMRPSEETSEEFEHVDEKHPSVHPTSMDNESALTTEESSADDKKQQGKPEAEVYPTLTDDKYSTTKPDEESPELEEGGLVDKPTEEGSVVKKPTVSEKPVSEDKVPQGEKETELVHSTTESKMTDGKPEETKPQDTQDFSSTMRPKPMGQHGVTGQGKPQTDDIPEEVLLHPTRMPGTYETEGPGHASDVEDDTMPSQKPFTESGTVATISPEGIIRPITKRPIYGTGKPVVSGDKESTTPGHTFIQLEPDTSEDIGEPEETFEATANPIFDIITGIPDNFAELFGIKPPTAGQKPDKDEKPEHTTHFIVPDLTTRVPDFKPQTTDHVKRPIHSTNGTHFIQYVPYKEGEVPLVPEGATLGELVERPDGEKYWPVIYMKFVSTTPGAEVPEQSFKPVPQQVFNGTHFIQYVPFDGDQEPEVPEGAALGQPQKGPDGQVYWPIIGNKPIMSPEDKPVTEQPYPWQVFNGTHFIQYVPVKEGQKPEVPEDATLGELETTPNGQKFWPIISNRPIPEDYSLTSQRPIQSQPEQIFNGTHFIQFAPYNDGQEPEVPEDATLGQPQKGPDGQIYWPIIDTKPLPAIPDKIESDTEQPVHTVQVFNGTNFIQYVPFKDGVKPEVPEGATLGQPQKGPDDQMYWPIIYMRPQPVKPQGSFPEQVYNGTHFIQYVPYKDGHKPLVPSEAVLGQPQKAPDGQMYWPIIYTKPVTAKPEDEVTTARPSQAPVFNGTHFIQYVPYMEGFEPDIPEEATLGKPEKKPDGETYWPVIYQKLPTRPKPDAVQHYPGQFFNGTHFVQYLPYRPSHKPHVPEGVTVSQPQKGPDGQMYWMIVSTKPLPTVEEKPIGPQFFNGTHFIQYVPYEKEKEPEVPEGAVLGKPETGTGGQKFWPIIYMKPLPGVPITYQKPLDNEQGELLEPYRGQVFNGTHYIQYVPYVPGKTPSVPEGGALGQLTKRPDGQMYWPIIFQRPVTGVPVTYEDQIQSFDPIRGPIFNGTHYVQYVPYKPGERPVLPDGATLGQPTKRPDGQLYWPIFYLRPAQETPVQKPTLWSPYDYIKPQPEQIYNGTHFIQYQPYNPTRMPEVPEGATLGQPQKGPGGQMYWVIISDKPLPAQTFNDTHVVQYVTPVTPEHERPQIDHNKPIQVFNGSHYIQYVPYTPGQKPVLPEGATLGQPTKGPEGQMYWPIIYMKPESGKPNQQMPIFLGPGYDHLEPVSGQIFNGTHYIRFIKYDPRIKPIAPEGATISEPQRRPDGQLYWVIASKKPLFDMQVPVKQQPGQIFNGTHYIQYVPYNSSQMPQVPEGAVLGHPQKGPEGQMYWVIISDKPLPAQPGTQYVQYVTPVTPEDDQMVPGPMFNGTHYFQYVPYKPAQVPKVPQDAVLGELHKGLGGQMYWPIIYRRPPQSFNGTHYIQYVPDNETGADITKPSAGAGYLQPVNATSKPVEDHPFWSYGQYAPRPGNGTLPTVNKIPSQKPVTEEHAFWTYGHNKPQNVSDDTYTYKPTTEHPSWSSGQIHNATRVPEVPKLPSGQYGGSDHSKPGYEYESGYYKPEKPERPSAPEDSYETIDEDHLIEYPSGSDYDETQEQPYGPGTCRYAGKVYVSAQQIPRDDPCDFCFCFRSDIICLQQSCPPPIPGCHEEPIQGFCCPRYECHVRMATLLNVTSTTTTTTTTLPPHFLSHVYKGAAGRTGCFIQGKAYRVGQAIPSASGPCMDCMCGGDGKMKCEPKVCTPEPMVRQMMVSSEKPTAANHR